MNDSEKTTEQLKDQLIEMRQRIAELEELAIEHKRLQATLNESKERFRSIFEKSEEAICLIDDQGHYRMVNDAMSRLTGVSGQDLIGMHYSTFLDRETHEMMEGYWSRRKSGEPMPSVYEFKLIRQGGEVRIVENVPTVINRDGKPPLTVAMLRDITERKQTEEALRKRKSELLLQKSRLEEANTALKVLLERRELDKSELQENVLSNVKQLVLPYLEKLKSTQLESYQMTLVRTLESHLTEIVSPFVTKLSARFLNLTPTQIQVANLIKDGKTSKEIASLLNLSENTILSYRYRIRSKLGLKNTKTNLRSYFLSLHD
ncbi:MAG: PAS domain S-box protein [Syntrophobacterales bacterium]|jgi:PAS domain S-box-containing protein